MRSVKRSKFYLSNEYIDFAYDLRLESEKKLIKSLEHDHEISLSLTKIMNDLNKLLETQSKIIDLFELKNIATTNFKLERSNYQTNEIISTSNQRIKDLNREISKLKLELNKRN